MSTCVEKVMNGDYNPFNPKIKFLNFNLLYSLWIMYGSYGLIQFYWHEYKYK